MEKKMHYDHEATCLCCLHLYFSGGSPGYSEYTPGWDASLGCIEGGWDFEEMSARTLHETMMSKAQSCPHWAPRD